LYLKNHYIEDLSPLEGLTKLEKLTVWGSYVSDIECLENLTSLKQLNLQDNSIEDISALTNLINLEELILSDNQISEISSLEGMKKIQKLQLVNNNVSLIESLRNMKNINWLWLGENPIEDYSPVISYYDSLEYTDFEPTRIVDDPNVAPMYTQQIDEELPEIIDVVGASINFENSTFDIKLNVRNMPDKMQINSPELDEDNEEYRWWVTFSDGYTKYIVDISYYKGSLEQSILWKNEYMDSFESYLGKIKDTGGVFPEVSYVGPTEIQFYSYDNSIHMQGILPEGFGTVTSAEIGTFHDDGIEVYEDSMEIQE